eukprot:2317317-Amphidinium_carterae.1
MTRVLFDTLLAKPTLLDNSPKSWRALLGRTMRWNDAADLTPQAFHGELAACAHALSIKGSVCKRKGLYGIDFYISSVPGRDALAIHLLADAELCPLTGEMLGPSQLREKHLQQMRCQCLYLRRREWMTLPTTEDRVD